jgi:hypothetical protein
VSVEQRRRGHEAHRMHRNVQVGHGILHKRPS